MVVLHSEWTPIATSYCPLRTLILPRSVNVFYHINQEHQDSSTEGLSDIEREVAKQEREFKIGSISFADSMGILLASIIAVPTEVGLCRAQVARGKMLCKAL